MTSKVQGGCRAELARAMLSRSLYSPMQLICRGKGTTFGNRYYDYSTLSKVIA